MLSVFQPAEGRGDQASDLGMLMIAGDLVTEVPPDALNRVEFRRVLRQEHQSEARVLGDPFADRLAGMELRSRGRLGGKVDQAVPDRPWEYDHPPITRSESDDSIAPL